ncbi:hypothetical protein HELRODRAFT_177414 [Helobdella robusta]|uniref:G-protein coupled receptors family 1 profile domain-containing protein n=1 Tax=Helobdella robusta TaxID=6412 RepID=T1FBN2_HELRO|nr:hypothetical protein HELRODRAFT_177414 [Helobdella robusta]ESN98169.1 hypothetical protein HELRODRAFT_177414 [Helobdella robusta]
MSNDVQASYDATYNYLNDNYFNYMSSSGNDSHLHNFSSLLNYSGIHGDNNNTDNETMDNVTYACLMYDFFASCIAIGLIAIFGIVGNLISYIVFSMDSVKTSTSFLLQALAVVDSLFLFFVIIAFVISHGVEFYEIYDHIEIKKYSFPVALFFQTATIWLVVLIGWNRYIAVCQPFKAAKLCTVVRAKRQLALLMLVCFIYCFPKFIEYSYLLENEKKTTLRHSTNDNFNNITISSGNHLAWVCARVDTCECMFLNDCVCVNMCGNLCVLTHVYHITSTNFSSFVVLKNPSIEMQALSVTDEKRCV